MDKKKVWGIGIGLLVTVIFVAVVKFVLGKKSEDAATPEA